MPFLENKLWGAPILLINGYRVSSPGGKTPFVARIIHFTLNVKGKGKGKGKAIPLQAWTGPECSRKLRFPDFKPMGAWRW